MGKEVVRWKRYICKNTCKILKIMKNYLCIRQRRQGEEKWFMTDIQSILVAKILLTWNLIWLFFDKEFAMISNLLWSSNLSVGGAGCKKCWCSDSDPQPLVWAPGSEAQTESGWGWWDESDSVQGREGCGETASGFSPSGSRLCWCACLGMRGIEEEWMSFHYLYFNTMLICMYASTDTVNKTTLYFSQWHLE